MSMKFSRTALAVGLGLASVVGLLAPASAFAVEGQGTRLAIAVPLVVPANSTGLIPAQTLAVYTAPGGLLTRQLDAVIDTPVAIGIDPMILVSIRVLGTSAPPTALDWLDRLEAASNDTFALGYADTDLALVSQAGGSLPIGPDTLEFALDPTLFAAEGDDDATPVPTPTAGPVDPVLPTTEQLLDWPYTLEGIAWPRDGSLVAGDLERIAAEYATTIVSSGNLNRDGGGAAAEVSGASVIVSDDAVSAALRAAAAGDSDAAAVSAAATSSGGGVVLATIDRSTPPSDDLLGQIIAALAADPSITLVRLGEAIADEPGSATLVDAAISENATRASALFTAATADRRFASIAANPDGISGPRNLSMLALLSNAWNINPAGWMRASGTFLDDSAALRASVQVAEIASLLLVADNNQYLPVNIDNALDQPVTVFVTLRPATAVLVVPEPRIEVTVPAQSQARVDVPVRSLTNGTVDFVVTLTGANGQQVGSDVAGEVNVQAGWETPIVIVIAGIVVLIFGVGIVRTILRRRRSADD
jgi:hypothetical protein